MKPRCHNRGPFVDPHAGWRRTGWNWVRIGPGGYPIEKPVYRYRLPWFEDRCATWDGNGIGQPTPEYPTGTPYPVAHGWADHCATCRHLPPRGVEYFLATAQQQLDIGQEPTLPPPGTRPAHPTTRRATP